jgi:hypothetical protein
MLQVDKFVDRRRDTAHRLAYFPKRLENHLDYHEPDADVHERRRLDGDGLGSSRRELLALPLPTP